MLEMLEIGQNSAIDTHSDRLQNSPIVHRSTLEVQFDETEKNKATRIETETEQHPIFQLSLSN